MLSERRALEPIQTDRYRNIEIRRVLDKSFSTRADLPVNCERCLGLQRADL